MPNEDAELKNINWERMKDQGVTLPALLEEKIGEREGRKVIVSKVEPADEKDHWTVEWDYAAGPKCINAWCKQSQVEGNNARKMCPLHEDMLQFLLTHLPNTQVDANTRFVKALRDAILPQTTQRQPGEKMKPKFYIAGADVALPGEETFIQVKKQAEKSDADKLEGGKKGAN